MRRIEYDLDERRITGISDDGAELSFAERGTLYDIRDGQLAKGRGAVAMRLVRKGYAVRMWQGFYRLTEAGKSAVSDGEMVAT